MKPTQRSDILNMIDAATATLASVSELVESIDIPESDDPTPTEPELLCYYAWDKATQEPDYRLWEEAEVCTWLTWSAFQTVRNTSTYDPDIMKSRIKRGVWHGVEHAENGGWCIVDIEHAFPSMLLNSDMTINWGAFNVLTDILNDLRNILPAAKIMVYVIPWRLGFNTVNMNDSVTHQWYDSMEKLCTDLTVARYVDALLVDCYDHYLDGDVGPAGEAWLAVERGTRPVEVALNNCNGKPVYLNVSHHKSGSAAKPVIPMTEFKQRHTRLMSVRGDSGEKPAGSVLYCRKGFSDPVPYAECIRKVGWGVTA